MLAVSWLREIIGEMIEFYRDRVHYVDAPTKEAIVHEVERLVFLRHQICRLFDGAAPQPIRTGDAFRALYDGMPLCYGGQGGGEDDAVGDRRFFHAGDDETDRRVVDMFLSRDGDYYSILEVARAEGGDR